MARRSSSPGKSAPTPSRNAARAAKRPAAAPTSGSGAEPPQGRVAQMRAVWSMTHEQDPKLPLIVIGPALAVLAVFVVVGGLVLHHWVVASIIGVLAALITGMTIFGRRATRTMYLQVEGRPGAAAAILQGMRGDWRVTPAVGFTRNQELVHRVVGRAGVVLVGEGPSTSAIRQLIVDQKKRISRVAPETPIHDLIVGENDPDRTPVRKLQTAVVKLPRSLRKTEVNAVEARMKALGGPNMPVPKGPIPTRMPRRQMR